MFAICPTSMVMLMLLIAAHMRPAGIAKRVLTERHGNCGVPLKGQPQHNDV